MIGNKDPKRTAAAGVLFILLVLKLLLIRYSVPNSYYAYLITIIMVLSVAAFALLPDKVQFLAFPAVIFAVFQFVEVIRIFPVFYIIPPSTAVFLFILMLIVLVALAYCSFSLPRWTIVLQTLYAFVYLFFYFKRFTGVSEIFKISAYFLVLSILIICQLFRLYISNQRRLRQVLQEETELNRKLTIADAKIIEQEKNAALTSLSAGLAHEIHNPVNYLQGNLVFMAEHLQTLRNLGMNNPDTEYIFEDLDKLMISYKNGFSRIQEIIGSLQNIFLKRNKGKSAVSVAETIKNIENTIPEHRRKLLRINLVRDFKVFAVSGELFSLFSIFVQNAFEAQDPQAGEGPAAKCVHIDISMVDGKRFVEICDNGPGISPEIAAKVFDPFFTTKDKNMGVGLALAYSIMRDLGGKIEFDRRRKLFCARLVFPQSSENP